jgi:hypothetical protein
MAASRQSEAFENTGPSERIASCSPFGCGLVQFTSDKRRADAHRFYAALGFEASHEA